MAEPSKAVGNFDYREMVRAEDFNEDRFANQAVTAATTMTETEGAVAAQLRQIHDDPRLSEFGKQEKRAEAVERQRKVVEDLEQQAESLRRARERKMAEIKEGKPDPKDAASEVRQREIRDRLQNLSQGEVLQIHQRAGENGDLETVAAIENAPAAFPLASRDAIERNRKDRIAKNFPDTMAVVNDQDRLLDTLDNGLAGLKSRLGLT